jgi:Flp pilus assembly protein TadG
MIHLKPKRHSESGQVTILVTMILSVFLLSFIALATDYATFWFTRQAVQGAADASCQAAAMDLLYYSQGIETASMNFTPSQGTTLSCATSSSAAPCIIAKYNGFDGTKPANTVQMSFPSSVSGVTNPTGVGVPFVQMDVTTNHPTYFSRLLTGKTTVPIHAKAVCGVVTQMAGGGLILLNPTISGSYLTSGNTSLKVIGGGGIGVQVNSNSSSAALVSGSPTEDLSKGGPNFTGSDFGLTGGPSSAITGFTGGTTGVWLPGDTRAPDPYASTPVPANVRLHSPTLPLTGLAVAYGTDGCPDHTANCLEFAPGYYPTGIVLSGYTTAIFQPGIYYMDGSITISGGVTLRMAKPAGTKQTDGMMFYFHSCSINMSGGISPHLVDSVASTVMSCDGSAPPASFGIPTSITGHVLVAQCVANGTYWDNYGDTTDGVGTVRGLVFYGDHGNTTSPALSGSSGISFAGNMYFHSTSYAIDMAMSGTSSTQAYWGSIVTDSVALSGGSTIPVLNSTLSLPSNKVAMFQ